MYSEAIIGLINAQGVHPTQCERNKLSLIIKWAQTSECSLLAITKTHTTSTDNPFTSPFFTHHHQVAHTSAQGKTAGVALISVRPGFAITKRAEALGGRLLVAEVSGAILKRPLVVTVVYAPDSGKGEATRIRFWNECHHTFPQTQTSLGTSMLHSGLRIPQTRQNKGHQGQLSGPSWRRKPLCTLLMRMCHNNSLLGWIPWLSGTDATTGQNLPGSIPTPA